MEQNKLTSYIVVDGVRYDIVKDSEDKNEECQRCCFCDRDHDYTCLLETNVGLTCWGGHHLVRHEGTAQQPSVGIHKQGYYSFPNGTEAEDVCRYLSFNKGNAVKYPCRAGRKPGADEVADLNKAIDYLENEIERLNEGKVSVDKVIVRDVLNTKDLVVGKVVANSDEQEGGNKC